MLRFLVAAAVGIQFVIKNPRKSLSKGSISAGMTGKNQQFLLAFLGGQYSQEYPTITLFFLCQVKA
jgi:hypothetical protein